MRDEFIHEWYFNSYLPLDYWKLIFTYQKISSIDLIEAVKKRTIDNKELWEILWCYFEMDDESIEKYYNLALSDIKEMKFKTFTSILHIVSTLMVMARDQFISKSVEEIRDMAKNYIDKLGQNLLWNDTEFPKATDLESLRFSSSGYGYHAKDMEEFNEIVHDIKNVMARKAKSNRKDRYFEIVNLIDENMDIDHIVIDPKFRYKDLFSENDPQVLWDKITSLSPKSFRNICHSFDAIIIKEQLSSFPEGIKYWEELLLLAKNFIEKNKQLNTEKSKCFHLKKYFIPIVEELLQKSDKKIRTRQLSYKCFPH